MEGQIDIWISRVGSQRKSVKCGKQEEDSQEVRRMESYWLFCQVFIALKHDAH